MTDMETIRQAALRWKSLLSETEQQRDQLLAALDRLCRELQSPAMEYLSMETRAAWSDAFDLVDRLQARKT